MRTFLNLILCVVIWLMGLFYLRGKMEDARMRHFIDVSAHRYVPDPPPQSLIDEGYEMFPVGIPWAWTVDGKYSLYWTERVLTWNAPDPKSAQPRKEK